MLKERIITGLSLLAFVIGVLFFTNVDVVRLVLLAFFSLAAWEWANLSGINHAIGRIGYAVVAMLSVLVLAWLSGIRSASPDMAMVRDIAGLGCLWWALALVWVMQYPGSVMFWNHRLVKMVMGLLVLVPSALSLMLLCGLPSGSWQFIYVLGIVVMADVGAYIFGRWLGKKKLAPKVSPGKSWAGFWGGFVLSLLYSAIVGSYFSIMDLHAMPLVAVSGVAALASVLGDLLESMLKRERGIKDSSQLLPGHGGFMDRMDSITAAAPVFVLLAILLRIPA